MTDNADAGSGQASNVRATGAPRKAARGAWRRTLIWAGFAGAADHEIWLWPAGGQGRVRRA